MLNNSVTPQKEKPSEQEVLESKPKSDVTNEAINDQLKIHQISVNLDKHDLIRDLHTWTDRFVLEFKLKIKEIPALMIERIGRSRYGHFKSGRNGFGLRNEIAINESFFGEWEY